MVETKNMDKKKIFSKWLPYLVALALFAIIACVYCAPEFEGKVVYAGDTINANSAVRESVQYRKDTGNNTWWTGAMFSGMPNYQIGGGRYASATLMKPLNKLFHPSATHLHLVFLMYFCCFFALLRSFKVDKWLSIVGALAIGFSSYFFIIEAAGHATKAWSIPLMSVVVGGFFLIFKKQYALGAALTMIFVSVGFSPHPQMAYYIFMLIGVLFCAELYIHIKEKRYKDLLISTLLFAGSVVVGMGTGMANIFANSEYMTETMRGGHSDLVQVAEGEKKSDGLDIKYATDWSYGIDESLTFMIPGFMGTASGYDVGTDSHLYETLVKNGVSKADAKSFCQSAPTYWGEQPFTVGSVYAGAIVCFLFVLGLLIVNGPYKWALLVATFFSFALAWGKNWMWLTELFFEYFPLYSKFRSVSSILIVAEVTVPLLGFLALKQIMDGTIDKKIINKNLYISAGITGGLCLIFALFGGSLFTFTSSNDANIASQLPGWAFSAIIEERSIMFRTDSFRSFLFIMLSAATVWLFTNNLIKKSWMIAVLGVLVVADMWPVNKRFLNESNFVTAKQNQSAFAMKPYEQAILTDKDPHFRVLNLTTSTFNDARTSYYLKSIGGYSAAKLRRYQDIIDQYLSKMDMDVISMLNAKYFIVADDEGKAVPQRNPYAMGNAWFVDTLLVAENANQECAALGSINLKTTAVMDKEFAGYVQNFTPVQGDDAQIALTSYAPDVLTYKSASGKAGTAVFSEIYYPYGWKAYIDNEPVDIFRVNYLLRAINIPAGNHDIRFEFRPDSVRKGDTLSLIFVGIMYASILAMIVVAVIRCRKNCVKG